jgi:hypothetical protein
MEFVVEIHYLNGNSSIFFYSTHVRTRDVYTSNLLLFMDYVLKNAVSIQKVYFFSDTFGSFSWVVNVYVFAMTYYFV